LLLHQQHSSCQHMVDILRTTFFPLQVCDAHLMYAFWQAPLPRAQEFWCSLTGSELMSAT